MPDIIPAFKTVFHQPLVRETFSWIYLLVIHITIRSISEAVFFFKCYQLYQQSSSFRLNITIQKLWIFAFSSPAFRDWLFGYPDCWYKELFPGIKSVWVYSLSPASNKSCVRIISKSLYFLVAWCIEFDGCNRQSNSKSHWQTSRGVLDLRTSGSPEEGCWH